MKQDQGWDWSRRMVLLNEWNGMKGMKVEREWQRKEARRIEKQTVPDFRTKILNEME